MNKIVVLLIFIITVNLGFMWFNQMDFFSSSPEGQGVTNLFSLTQGIGWITTGFLAIGLGLLAAFASQFLKINAFGIIAFTEFFWIPYANTITVFYSVLKDAPSAFLGIITIFTTLMTLLYLYTMIEWSRIPGGV